MRMVQEEDHPEVALEEMLDFPEAEADILNSQSPKATDEQRDPRASCWFS